MFNDPDGRYKILNTNFTDNSFEPDIVMDADEWVFNILYYYIEDISGDGSPSCSTQPSG